jgi:hypothetical protein
LNEVHEKPQALVHWCLWVRSSFHVVDVISFLQEGSLAAVAIDQSARHASRGEGSASTNSRLEGEDLVKPREVAESSRKLGGQARAQSD